MTKKEILVHITVLEGEVVKLQLRLRDLHLQIKEGIDNPPSDAVASPCRHGHRFCVTCHHSEIWE